MGKIMSNGIPYCSNRSAVEANPSGEATDTLSKIGIDNVIYEILGGGAGGNGKAVGIRDVTNYITPSSGIVLDSNFKYKAIQIGNLVFLNARGTITSGYASEGTNFTLFDIDQNIAPQMNTDNFAFGAGSSNRVAMVNSSELKVRANTGSWCGFEIYWTVEETYMGDTEYTFSPVIYSTEEREIGVWTDGKPLYQKTVHIQNTVSSFSDYINGIYMPEVDTAISMNFVALRNVNGSIIQICGNAMSRAETLTNYMIGLRMFNGYLQYRCDTYGSAITDIYVTLQYTKTTDTPGSGTWTPSGVPAVHYSTEEQIIGTWMGKTLYQKTQIGGIDFTQADTWYDTTITGIDEVIEVKGSILRSGEQIELGAFIDAVIARWILRNNTIKLSLTSIPSWDTFVLKSVTVKYTKSTD
ncbi:MAG: hypothetical protein IJ716_14285 [Lachnospiraceae bacterium]|nr:hypothetical protein [Lachnospiraceae bacterium]